MEVLYEWVWNVAVYLLLVTAVTNVLPGDTYRKYLKFFTGVCLVIVMTQPLFSLFGMEEQLENAFRFYRFSGEQEELREEMAGMGEIGRRAVLDQYETMLKAQLLDLAAQEEVVLTDIELLLETDEKSGSYGSVLYVSARVSEGEEGQATALIRRLTVQWNMPEENINLHSGQGGGNYGY